MGICNDVVDYSFMKLAQLFVFVGRIKHMTNWSIHSCMISKNFK
jgi:hypothetical protein